MGFLATLLSNLQLRNDSSVHGGWYNDTTGIGTVADKSTGWRFTPPRQWTVQELADLYEADSIAGRAVDAIVNDALREGFSIVDKSGDPTAGDAWIARADLLYDFTNTLTQLLKEKRLYGGVAVLPITAGEQSAALSEPYTDGKIKAIRWVEPDCATPIQWGRDPASRQFQLPTQWSIWLRGNGGTHAFWSSVHHSRVVPIYGGRWTKRSQHEASSRQLYPHWPLSVLTPVMEGLRIYRSVMASTGALFQDAGQAVFKLNDLRSALYQAEDGAEKMREWLYLQNLMRSAINAIALSNGDGDQPAESFERVNTPMTDMHNLIDRFQSMVAEALDMPVTRLFKEAPGGLSTDDESGQKQWYDTVQSFRTEDVAPLIRTLVGWIKDDVDVPLPEGWDLNWPSLWQYSPKEEAAIRLNVASSDALYLTHGVFLPEDVAVTRSQKDGYRHDIQIDQSSLDEIRGTVQAAMAEDAPSTPAEDADPVEEALSEPGVESVEPAAAMNGGQVTALAALAAAVGAGELPIETAVQIALVAFPIDEAKARAIFSPITPKVPDDSADPGRSPDAPPSPPQKPPVV